MASIKDIYWLAGLLEGEGCFSIHKKYYTKKSGAISTNYTPIIDVSSIDRDTIERASKLFHYSAITSQSHKARIRVGGNFQKHATKIYASKAIGWMMTIYSLMSKRRKTRIKGIVEDWKSR